MNVDDITTLSYEQKKRYAAAISAGYFDDYEDDPKTWKHSFVGAFIRKYPNRIKFLNTIVNIVGEKPAWDSFNEVALKDIVDELDEQGYAPNSIHTMTAELKALLNENYKLVPCSREDFSRILSSRKTVSQAVYITRDEMESIVEYKPVGPIEEFVHRNFVVEMLTGARRVDAEGLSVDNCDMETNTLSYVPQKTPGVVVYVPVDEKMRLREFLANKTSRLCTATVFNETVRRICRKCKLTTQHTITKANNTITGEKWQLVSSHTARRSFATNLYLAGISLEDIAQMMGHGKNIETTKRYICAERKVTPIIMSYFMSKDKTYMLSEDYCRGYNAGLKQAADTMALNGFFDVDSEGYNLILSMEKDVSSNGLKT